MLGTEHNFFLIQLQEEQSAPLLNKHNQLLNTCRMKRLIIEQDHKMYFLTRTTKQAVENMIAKPKGMSESLNCYSQLHLYHVNLDFMYTFPRTHPQR